MLIPGREPKLPAWMSYNRGAAFAPLRLDTVGGQGREPQPPTDLGIGQKVGESRNVRTGGETIAFGLVSPGIVAGRRASG